MTITMTALEEGAEAEMNSLHNPEPDEFIYQVPSWEGKGYV